MNISGRVIRLERGRQRPDPRDLTTWTDADLLGAIFPERNERRDFMAMTEADQRTMLEAIGEGV